MLCKVFDIVPTLDATLPGRNYFSDFTYEKTELEQVAAT